MPIKFARLGEEVEIRRLTTDAGIRRHLENLGISIGQKVTVLSAEGGALILRVKESRLALDATMSSGIFI